MRICVGLSDRSGENITSIIQRSDLVDRANQAPLFTSLMAVAIDYCAYSQPLEARDRDCEIAIDVFRHRTSPGVLLPRPGLS